MFSQHNTPAKGASSVSTRSRPPSQSPTHMRPFDRPSDSLLRASSYSSLGTSHQLSSSPTPQPSRPQNGPPPSSSLVPYKSGSPSAESVTEQSNPKRYGEPQYTSAVEKARWKRVYEAVVFDYIDIGPSLWNQDLASAIDKRWRQVFGHDVADEVLPEWAVHVVPHHSRFSSYANRVKGQTKGMGLEFDAQKGGIEKPHSDVLPSLRGPH